MAESNPTQVILTDDGLKIIKAQNTADNAFSGVGKMNDPNCLSPFEKSQLKIQMDNFATNYASDKDIATSEGIDFTEYDTAYQAYLAYMTPLIADMTTYSPIVRTTFYSMVTAVQVEQKRFSAATQVRYNQQIKKAQTDIDDGQTKYKALKADADAMVKKGDVVNQFNIDAGGALLSTSGNSTKIVFSSPNIIFDSANPVQVPNANIPGVLTGKTFEAGTITATTKITGSEIEAPLIHSPSGSFKLDGNTGDIIGASIHSADNSWGIDKNGNINGATINGATINGTAFHGGDIINDANNTSKFYPTTISSDGHIYTARLTPVDAMQTDLSTGALTTKYRATNSSSNRYEAYDTTLQADQIALFAGHTNGKDMSFAQSVTGSNQDGYVLISPLGGLTLHGDNQQITFNGTSDDIKPKGIIITPYGNINPNGTQNIWYVGNNMNMKTASFGMDADQKFGINLSRKTFVDEIEAMGNRLPNGRLFLHAVDNDAQMYLLNDGSPAFVSPTIYNRTYSDGANMFVTSSGRVGRSTSASKYKLAIARSDDTAQADRLMTLNLASWNDKVATEKMAESLSNGETPAEAEINLKRHYGLIAEDLRDAGLDEFLITGKDGQIEGIEYDRLWTVLIPKIKQLNNRINELERKTL